MAEDAVDDVVRVGGLQAGPCRTTELGLVGKGDAAPDLPERLVALSKASPVVSSKEDDTPSENSSPDGVNPSDLAAFLDAGGEAAHALDCIVDRAREVLSPLGREYDEEKVKSTKEDVDTLLVFVRPHLPYSSH